MDTTIPKSKSFALHLLSILQSSPSSSSHLSPSHTTTISALSFLSHHLQIQSLPATALVIAFFFEYAFDFLCQHHHQHQQTPNQQNHPHLDSLLDPDIRQIRLRLNLTMYHRHADWLWTQQHDTHPHWTQDEHATVFVLRVLEASFEYGLLPKECAIAEAVGPVHQQLCVLQSVVLGRDTWVEDEVLRRELCEKMLVVLEAVAGGAEGEKRRGIGSGFGMGFSGG
ncbi:uncharacterized protein C8A04DRAFT_14130 [Dichotomopilus funicola]|uniref:Uncharacterized protein n=1 Tax=Dichotomopilus funicola TaxID=1934379 RepID=A0AAN6UY70_9PEZI|nr:hypothetical protein C8A04DRAFT_14130 [Dichotomopilus funicola]